MSETTGTPLPEATEVRAPSSLWDDLKTRIGKFEISMVFFESAPEEVMRILGRCLVVRAEWLFHKRTIEYMAYSLDFDTGPEFRAAPEYIWETNTVEDTLRAIRADSLPPLNMPDVETLIANAKDTDGD